MVDGRIKTMSNRQHYIEKNENTCGYIGSPICSFSFLHIFCYDLTCTCAFYKHITQTIIFLLYFCRTLSYCYKLLKKS